MMLLISCYKSLCKNRFRSLLSVLGIVFGVAALISMLAALEGAKMQTLKEINRLGVKNVLVRGEEGQLTNEYLHSLEFALQDSAKLAAVYKVETNSFLHLSGVSPSYGEIFHLSMHKGRWISELDELSKSLVIVLGKERAATLGPKGALGQTLTIDGEKFTIIGVLDDETEGSLIHQDLKLAAFIPLSTATSVRPLSSSIDALSEIVIQADFEGDAVAIGDIVRTQIKRNSKTKGTQVIVAEELRRQKEKTQLTFNVILASVAAVTLLVGGMGIVNVQLASVFERTKEIGVRRALGATRSQIKEQFLLEALLLGTVGALGGVFLGFILANCIEFLTDLPIYVAWWSLVIGAALALIVSALAGLYPANQAAKLEPVEALRVN